MAVTYTEADIALTLSTASSWTAIDVNTVHSIPLGAVLECILTNANETVAYHPGIRTGGSSLDRYITYSFNDAEGGGVSAFREFVKVNESTGEIEYYTDSTTDVGIKVVGYFTGVDFTELDDTAVGSASVGAWYAEDINTTQSVPLGAVCSFQIRNASGFAEREGGVRTGGSSLSRIVDILKGETGDPFQSMVAKCNATSGEIETYKESTDIVVLLTGYFASDLDYIEAWQSLTHTTDGAWVDNDLTSYLDEDGRVVDILFINAEIASENVVGVRENGGSDYTRSWSLREAEGGGYVATCISAQTDANGVVELYHEDASFGAFVLVGYYTWEEEAGEGNIKTVNGIAWANVKSVNGVAKANIKSINGVSAS